MIMEVPKILVSILTYNNVEDTIETIRCFQRQSYRNFDLVVIDNASPGNCADLIRKACPGVEVVRSKVNSGYTGGNNFALDRGLNEGFDYVLISNHDVSFPPDLMKNLIETAEDQPDCGVVGAIEEAYQTGEITTCSST